MFTVRNVESIKFLQKERKQLNKNDLLLKEIELNRRRQWHYRTIGKKSFLETLYDGPINSSGQEYNTYPSKDLKRDIVNVNNKIVLSIQDARMDYELAQRRVVSERIQAYSIVQGMAKRALKQYNDMLQQRHDMLVEEARKKVAAFLLREEQRVRELMKAPKEDKNLPEGDQSYKDEELPVGNSGWVKAGKRDHMPERKEARPTSVKQKKIKRVIVEPYTDRTGINYPIIYPSTFTRRKIELYGMLSRTDLGRALLEGYCRVWIKMNRIDVSMVEDICQDLIKDITDPVETVSDVKPQMDSAANLINAGSNLISTIRGDNNRDKPPIPLQPMSFIPQGVTSLSYTDNVEEPVNILRARAGGQRPQQSNVDEMSLDYVLRKSGLLKTVKIFTSQASGSLIVDIPAVPLDTLSNYPLTGGAYVVPPVALFSSCYAYFRGSLSYDLYIVGGKFYSLRLLVAAIPRLDMYKDGVTTLNLELAKMSPYKIFDLMDSSHFEFSVPWYWHNPFAKVRDSDVFDIPSRLVIFILNPLIAIENVPNRVYMNIFVKAGQDYEVAIPRPSILDVDLSDPIKPPVSQYIYPYDKYTVLFTTWERNLKFTDDRYAITINYGTGTDTWVGYTNLNNYFIWGLEDKTVKGLTYRVGYYKKKTAKSTEVELVYVKYGVYDDALSTSNAHGLVVFDQLVKAQGFAKAAKKNGSITPAIRSQWCDPWLQDGPYSQVEIYNPSTKKKEWRPALEVDGLPQWSFREDPKLESNYYMLNREVEGSWIPILPVPQMDPEGVVADNIVVRNIKSNTELVGLPNEEKGIPAEDVLGLGRLAISAQPPAFATLHDRWLYLETVSWDTTMATDYRIWSFDLFGDLFDKNVASPNLQLFFLHRYFRGTVVFKFVLNSNVFQVGSIIASCTYGSSWRSPSLWDNVFSALQRNHAPLSAGSNNDAELVIPYHSPHSMQYNGKENYCSVILYCLNPLIVSGTTVPKCNISVFVRFENMTYGGMISRDIGIHDRPEPQMDNDAFIEPILSTPSSSMGLSVFGEKTPDLKSILRRYTHYTSLKFKPCIDVLPRDCPYVAKLRLSYRRRVDPKMSYEYDNRWRHGIPGLISSNYYLADGGLRFKFFVIGAPPEGTVIYVQHRFDDFISDKHVPFLMGPSKARERNHLMNTQYATFAQPLSVNSTFSIEIPYYSMNQKLSLSFNDRPEDTDLGCLYIWAHAKVQDFIQLEVLYAIADDTRFSVFQGSPRVNDMSLLAPEPQGDNEEVPLTSNDRVTIEAIPERKFVDRVKHVFSTPKRFVQGLVDLKSETSEALKSVTKTGEYVRQLGEDIKGVAMDKIEEATSWSELAKMLPNKIYDIASHLIYAILSPTVGIISWAVANVLMIIFNVGTSVVSGLVSCIGKLWNKMTCSPKQPQKEKPEPQGYNDNPVEQYASLLYTLIATLCELKVNPITSYESLTKGLFKFGLTARNGFSVGKFFSDNFELLKRVINSIVGLFKSDSDNFAFVAGINDDRMKTWLKETMFLLSPQNEDKLVLDHEYTNKIFEVIIVGKAIQSTLVMAKEAPPRLLTLVNDQLKRLGEVESKLINLKVFSGTRYEPFCVWFAGDAGCGKTALMQELASIFAAYSQSSSLPYYPMTGGQKFFDGFIGQPTIYIDDFMTMSPAQDAESYMQFLQMKGSSLFNPPFSITHDKCKMINFQNLFITSNRLFFNGIPGIHDEVAYERRRDILIDFKLISGWNPLRVKKSYEINDKDEPINPSDFKITSELAHCRIYHYVDSNDPNSKRELLPVEGKTLKETLFDFVQDEGMRYHRKEIGSYKSRCKTLQESIRKTKVESGASLNEALDAYAKMIDETSGKLFSRLPGKTILTSVSKFFSRWKETSVESSSFVPKCVIPQDGFDNYFPFELLSPDYLALYDEGEVIHPRERPIAYKGDLCLHKTMNMEDTSYLSSGIFSSSVLDQKEDEAYVCPYGPCHIKTTSGVASLPGCVFLNPIEKRKWIMNFLQSNASQSIITPAIRTLVTNPDSSVLNAYFPKEFIDIIKDQYLIVPSKTNTLSAATYVLADEQEKMKRGKEVIGDHVVPTYSIWQNIKQTVWDGIKKLFKCLLYLITNVLKFVAKLFTAAVTVYGFIAAMGIVGAGISSGVRYFNPNFGVMPEEDVESQLHPSGDFKTLKSGRSMKAKALNLVEGQGCEVSDDADIVALCKRESGLSGLIDKIRKNTFFLIGEVDNEEGRRVYRSRCIGLYEKKFLVLKHYIEHFKSLGVTILHVLYHQANGLISYKFDEVKFKWTDQGYGVGELPNSAPRQFANITKYMPSENFDGNYPSQCCLYEVKQDRMVEHNIEVRSLKEPVIVSGTSTQSSWKIVQGFEYNFGGKGVCGSFLIAPQMACPLIGIHTAGIGEKKGFAELLLKETFVVKDQRIIEYINPQMEIGDNVYSLDGFYSIEGQLDPQMVPRLSRKTKILPSEISPVFPVMTEPAPLDNKDPRLSEPADILRIGVSKRCAPLREFPSEAIKIASEDYSRMLKLKVRPLRSKVEPLSIVDAIEGFAIPGYESMEMKTSEGYPWIKMRPGGCSDKSWMFQLSEYKDGRLKVEGIFGELDRVLNTKLELRKRGVVPLTYFTECLKDARILKSKISEPGKTRIFEISPVDLTIVQRQYYLDFIAAYHEARMDSEHTIGINPDGAEWSQLANDLRAFSPYILTADYSSYGPRLSHTILKETFEGIDDWYAYYEKENAYENNIVRKCIGHEVIHGLHVVNDLVFRPTSGMPSGNVKTIDLNTGCNSIYIRIAFFELAKRMGLRYRMGEFRRFVKMYSNGDDLIISVKEEIIAWFNNVTLIAFFAEFGLKMTDALKSGVVRPYCSIEEATYLKRGFKKHPFREGQWLAPLEESSITDTANWIWRSVNHREASLVNSEMSCRLAYTQGPEYYLNHCKIIQNAWFSLGVQFDYPSWYLLDDHIWEGKPGPVYRF